MKSSRILIIVWPEASAYNATYPLARVLRQRGHQIAYAVPPRWQHPVSQQGFETVSLDVSGPSLTAPNGWRGILASRQEARRRISELCESLASLRSSGFDLVLLYPTLWHYALALRRLGIPYIIANANLGSTWNLEIPPIFSGLQPFPGRPLLNRLVCARAWFVFRYFGAFSHRYRGIIQPRPSGIPARIRDAGIAARHFFRNVLEPLSMPVYHQVLQMARHEGVAVRWGDYGHRLEETELVFGPRFIDFPRSFRYPRVYVGTCVDTERAEGDFDWSRVDPSRPLVYCAVGSHSGYWNVQNRLRLIESVIESFRTRADYQVLLQTAPEDVSRFGSLPDNILAAPWVPQLQVLARASLLITHGGFGTVREALFFGVPMIIFPFGVDQPGNAARVTRLQVGLSGDVRTVTPATISSLVRAVEMSPYRENALRLSRALQADRSCSEAVAVIESILADSVTGAAAADQGGPRCDD